MRRALPLLLGLVWAGLLAGCVEADETIALDSDGGGTYRLSVRWNADLWRRAGDAIGDKARRALATPGVPLSATAWRDAFEPVPGIEIVELEEETQDGGWKQLRVELRFRHLRDLWRFEFLGNRNIRVGRDPKTTSGGLRHARIDLDLMKQIPVLDPVAAIVRAERKGTARPPEGVRGDKDLMAKVGLSRERIGLVWDLVGPAIEKARVSFTLEIAGQVIDRADKATDEKADRTTWRIDFGDLQAEEAPRKTWMIWEPRSTDSIPEFVHPKPEARTEATKQEDEAGDGTESEKK